MHLLVGSSLNDSNRVKWLTAKYYGQRLSQGIEKDIKTECDSPGKAQDSAIQSLITCPSLNSYGSLQI